LRLACTVRGQQIGFWKKPLFCTSDAVDMQRFFHSWIPAQDVWQALLATVLLSGLGLKVLVHVL